MTLAVSGVGRLMGQHCCPASMVAPAWVRRAKELAADHISDLGGEVNCSAAERSLIRRAVTLTIELERMERQFALAGEASAEDLEIYARVAGNLRRLLEAVGLQRRARHITPTLDEYLEQGEISE